eukprot:scaffold13688_cov21-Prasinocladus_malaysianus.AAC.1
MNGLTASFDAHTLAATLCRPDRHLPAADIPDEKPHIVIVESTYGVASHSAREEREQRFVQM